MAKTGETVKFKNRARKTKSPLLIDDNFESILVPENNGKENPDDSYTNKYQNHVRCSFGFKLVCIHDQFSKLFKSSLGQGAVHKFITNMIKERKYCCCVIKKHFNKELVMTKEHDEILESSTKCCICGNTFIEGDIKVRDYCHVTGEKRGAVQADCNINVGLNKKFPSSFTIKKRKIHILLSKNLENLILK